MCILSSPYSLQNVMFRLFFDLQAVIKHFVARSNPSSASLPLGGDQIE